MLYMKLKLPCTLLIFVLCNISNLSGNAQNIDSLKRSLATLPNKEKAVAMEKLCGKYISLNLDSALKYGMTGLEIARKNGFETEEANLLNSLGNVFLEKGKYSEALSNYISAQNIFDKQKNVEGNITIDLNLGHVYQLQNLTDKAQNYYNRALKLAEESGKKQLMADALNLLGALFYYKDSVNLALDYFLRSVQVSEEINNLTNVNVGLSNVAVIYQGLGKYEEALQYLNKAGGYARQSGNKKNLAAVYYNIALVYRDQKKPAQAILYLDSCVSLSKTIKQFEFIQLSSYELSLIYTDLKDYQKALEKFKDFSFAKDSALQQMKQKDFADMATKYETGKKEAENKILKTEGEKQRTINIAISAGLVLVTAFTFFILRGYRQKQRANQLLRLQNIEINDKKHIIEEKQKEILDSITYAKRLQEAILPSLEQFHSCLENAFIYYQPKDIVAGDFYWMHIVDGFEGGAALKEKNIPDKKLVLVAAADCTGHGVPGAMVSVVCSNALNRAVLQYGLYDPGKILDKTLELVLETFAKSDKDVKDGMDISLCVIEKNTKSDKINISWAGANNPLWYTNNNEIVEVTANKQPIGKSYQPEPFITHHLQLQKGDALFLFTDGFADQFGGPKGKKFKYKQLKEFLLSNVHLNSGEQNKKLEHRFQTWKGDLEQVDDVCVIGIKV